MNPTPNMNPKQEGQFPMHHQEGKIQQSRNLENSIGLIESQIKELCAYQQELFQRLDPVLNKNIPIREYGEQIEKEPESSILNMTLIKFSKILCQLKNDTKNIICQLDI